MNRAVAIIEDEILLGHERSDIATKILVGNEQDIVLRQILADLERIR